MTYSRYLRDNHSFSYGSSRDDLDLDDEVSENADVSGHYTKVHDSAQEIQTSDHEEISVGITKRDYEAYKKVNNVNHESVYLNKGKKDTRSRFLDSIIKNLTEEEDE